jgi:integrase
MRSRARILTLDEFQRMINAADADFREIVLAGLHTGARWGELRRLSPSDYNSAAGTLTIQRSKSGKGRHVVVNDDGARFFEQAVAKAVHRSHLFVRADGKPWGGNWQVPLMKAASERAGIKPAATFHLLRHSWASHALLAGAPLMVIARQLGHSTTEMAQRHYAHLTEDFVAHEIRRAAPTFKSASDRVVTRLRTRQAVHRG